MFRLAGIFGSLLILILFGYLIGSFSPGYFFGRLVKGVDIRKYGNGGTGATNTYRFIGPVYGISTGIFDALKAIFVFYVSANFVSFDLAIIPGLAAVLGHNLPFYLNFKGGRGAASLLGLNFVVLLSSQSIYALSLLLGSLVYSFIISEERKKIWPQTPGRYAAKISALVLPLGFIWFSKEIVLATLILLSVFLIFDFIRFLNPKVNRWYLASKKFSKEKELKRLSGYSFFLISAAVLFNFFPKEIAAVSLVFFVIGDLLAPAGQLRYLPHQKILSGLLKQTDKTLGGVIVIFVFSLLAGMFLRSLTPLDLSFNFIIAGALAGAALDQFSVFLDDNILVPLGIGSILWLLIFL